MRRRYKQFARKTYRFLRHPRRRRKSRLHGWLGASVYNRDLWKPQRHTIAVGVAIGLAVSMLPPIPVQMLVAAIIAVLLHGNIPIAAAACWVSNPVTAVPILLWQNAIGDWLLKPGIYEELHPHFHGLRCTALGAVVIAIVLAPLGYFLVYALWDAASWLVRRALPTRAVSAAPTAELEPEAAEMLAPSEALGSPSAKP